MQETQSSLIERVRNPHDARSWHEFKELYEPLLLAQVRSRGLSEADGRDVVQDVFIALWRGLQSFKLDRSRGRFRTWLYQVARNAMIDWSRRQRRRNNAEEGWRERMESLEAHTPEEEADWNTSCRRRVLEVVLALVKEQSQPKTWACFEQKVLQDRPGADVAAELGLTVNAVYVYASRVQARVRDLCAEYLEELSDA
jgi:RNA polymerase sigma-70 factor (ECF subfamily)